MIQTLSEACSITVGFSSIFNCIYYTIDPMPLFNTTEDPVKSHEEFLSLHYSLRSHLYCKCFDNFPP